MVKGTSGKIRIKTPKVSVIGTTPRAPPRPPKGNKGTTAKGTNNPAGKGAEPRFPYDEYT